MLPCLVDVVLENSGRQSRHKPTQERGKGCRGDGGKAFWSEAEAEGVKGEFVAEGAADRGGVRCYNDEASRVLENCHRRRTAW